MRNMALIQLTNITKNFEEIVALDHINLLVEDGEYLCILGPTGAGKTTLLRIIAGLLDPDEGTIHIAGNLMNTRPPEERDTVYMFQQYALFPHMNVWDNVSFSPTIKDWTPEKVKEITAEVLEMVRLTDRADALPNELSGGMQQRIALARGIASGARILLLDEPLGALDARLRITIRSQLRKLVKDQRLTAIHVTHDQEEALMIADRIAVLREGKIEQIGSPHEVYAKPRSIFVTSFVGGANFLEGYVSTTEKEETRIEIRGGFNLYVRNAEKASGERIIVAFRREDTSVSSTHSDGKNSFHGRVDSAMFIGGSMEYQIRLENDIIVSSKILLSDTSRTFRRGEHVVVSFPVDKCHLFAYPERGLLKEIEAI
jgi:ABC-type Fe3+/spermidine/putrescine transport system ATPase subunit